MVHLAAQVTEHGILPDEVVLHLKGVGGGGGSPWMVSSQLSKVIYYCLPAAQRTG